jgi:hypothetical protein
VPVFLCLAHADGSTPSPSGSRVKSESVGGANLEFDFFLPSS